MPSASSPLPPPAEDAAAPADAPQVAPRPRRPALFANDSDERTELQRYVGVLVERWFLLLGAVVLAEILALLLVSTQPPSYETRSTILVEPSMPHVLGSAAGELADPSPANFYLVQDYLQTSRRILTSDSLAARAAGRLKLLSEPGFFQIPGEKTAPTLPKSLAEAGEILLGHYTADVIMETRLLVVTARHQSPEWAKRIADAVADEFVTGTAETREHTTQKTSQQLADELDGLRKGLREAELALYTFKSEHDILSVSLEDRANQIARQIDKYTDALTEVKLRKLQRQSQVAELKKLKDVDPLHIPMLGAEMPALLSDLRRTYAEEQRRLAELRARYEDRHPQVQQQTSKVEQLLRELAREVEVALSAATLRLSETESDEKKVLTELATLKAEGLKLSRLEIEFNKLKRDADSLQKQYNLLLNREKETGMAYRLSQSYLKVLDYARLPKVPVSPRKRVALLLALLGGLGLGVGLAFILDAIDRSLKTPEEVEAHLRLPLLGLLPEVAGSSRTRAAADLYVAEHPRSPVAEAWRTVRTNLLFSSADRPLTTILLTSSVAREGKTLCSISLGTVLAQAGQRTLLVDCDLRRPRLGKALGLRDAVGLTSVLVGDAQLEDAIRETPVEGLSILPAGPSPPNPAELLASASFRKLLAKLRTDYDRVILDSPPAVPVTDPAILATLVDGVILVVRHATTHRELARRAVTQLADVNAHLLGIVLNQVAANHKGYRAYYGHYGDYHSDGDSPRR